jgi:ubiquinone/menaquinone biosynthesis C-methylase UbiE
MIELKTAEEVHQAWLEAENCWMSKEIPKLQYEMVVKNELVNYAKGVQIAPYDAFVQCLFRIPDELDKPETSFLDVGASGAYYNEIMKLAGFKYNYTGCDWNPEFKELAKKLYPEIKFDIEDARRLTYHDGQFDIVMSACCMLHIRDYRTIVFETARVTKKYAIFHRQPILHSKQTTYYKKEAYGIPCIEIHFNEQEFLTLLKQAGLRLLHFERIFTVNEDGGYSHITYLTEKTQ